MKWLRALYDWITLPPMCGACRKRRSSWVCEIGPPGGKKAKMPMCSVCAQAIVDVSVSEFERDTGAVELIEWEEKHTLAALPIEERAP